ncbi:MAG: hypothetical protein LN409_00570, partial [Candidatus Thermoplasmatota archaeon]|nr:hypothetical protein [Candidatus Thermoplasmatota archaeon]
MRGRGNEEIGRVPRLVASAKSYLTDKNRLGSVILVALLVVFLGIGVPVYSMFLFKYVVMSTHFMWKLLCTIFTIAGVLLVATEEPSAKDQDSRGS